MKEMKKNKVKYSCCVGMLVMLVSCELKPADHDALVQIGENTLSRTELREAMPKNLSAQDSAEFADAYIRQWIDGVLLYDVARKNISEAGRIDRAVEQYRRDLVIYEYRRRYSAERVEKDFDETQLRDFYRKNQNRFILESGLIKGILLRVPETAPDIDLLRKWYSSDDQDDIENIEKYGMRNAINYDYFYDHWVLLSDVLANIPQEVTDHAAFLKKTHTLELNSDGEYYFLHITEYQLPGSVMPFEYARPLVEEQLSNQLRVKFNKELQQNLYREAERDGSIKRYY